MFVLALLPRDECVPRAVSILPQMRRRGCRTSPNGIPGARRLHRDVCDVTPRDAMTEIHNELVPGNPGRILLDPTPRAGVVMSLNLFVRMRMKSVHADLPRQNFVRNLNYHKKIENGSL
jgi:hypothetical protein